MARPRLYPVDRSALLLGVCVPELAGRRLTVDGRRLLVAEYGRVALLLTFVDRLAYGPAALERFRTDATSLAAEARLLEVAVERARVHGAVVPMRLLTVASSGTHLEELAREQGRTWSRALTRFGATRECAVHLFFGPHVPPGGNDPYVLRVADRAVRTGRFALKERSAAVDHARGIWRLCVERALATRRLPTASERGVLLSGVLLFDESSIEAFAVDFEHDAAAGLPLGITAYLEAPRAPFSFVSS